MLIFGGFIYLYIDGIIKKAIEIMLNLVLFAINYTHLVQPLDIAVFKTFKVTLKK